MSINIAAIQTFADTDLLTLYRYALAQLALSESIEIEGRKITRSSIPYIIQAISYLEERINDANFAQAGGNVALVGFGEPSFTANPVSGTDSYS